MTAPSKAGPRIAVNTPHVPRTGASCSQGVASDMRCIAGQFPVDPESGAVPTRPGDQWRVLGNLAAIARAHGMSGEQAVRVGVYLTDPESFQQMDVAYRDFNQPPPGRTTAGVPIRGVEVEMDATVARDSGA